MTKTQEPPKNVLSRRDFVAASTLGAIAGASALADPAAAAARAAGIKRGDLPDLTVKQVKVYATDLGNRKPLNSTDKGEVACVVTQSGIEGFYSLGNRGGTGAEWLEYANRVLPGKSAFNHDELTPRFMRLMEGTPQNWYASAVDICLWDILGKAVGLPIYRLLGAYQERVPTVPSKSEAAGQGRRYWGKPV
jgi:L-alanine-DL-glutamate epimerase-like enolase superfamily enzyme